MYRESVFMVCVSQRRRVTAIGLPMALFVVLILSLIGLAVQRGADNSAVSQSHQIATVQAWYAANSALQMWMPTVLSTALCRCPAADTLVMTAPGLDGCSVSRRCSLITVEGDTYCTLVSLAHCDGGNASRSVEVRVK
jgi:MSHA biogenesis protein MshP